MNMNTNTRIKNLIKLKSGMDTSTPGENYFLSVLNQRIKKTNCTNAENYLEKLLSDKVEIENLIDATAVPETWFFRDHTQLKGFVDYFKQKKLHSPDKKINILSLPCSSGEEPYSIAICLLESGATAKDFSIDAVDIRPDAIAKAESATYRKNSFRAKDCEDLFKKYFKQQGTSYVVNHSVTEHVHFKHVNMFDLKFSVHEQEYDFIFFRNLLIYFDTDTQARSLRLLHRKLTDTGILFTGPAESLVVTANLFNADSSYLYAFGKTSPEQQKALLKTHSKNVKKILHFNRPAGKAEKPARPSKRIKPLNTSKHQKHNRPDKDKKSSQINRIEEARKYANQGDLEAAIAMCHES